MIRQYACEYRASSLPLESTFESFERLELYAQAYAKSAGYVLQLLKARKGKEGDSATWIVNTLAKTIVK